MLSKIPVSTLVLSIVFVLYIYFEPKIDIDKEYIYLWYTNFKRERQWIRLKR